MHIVASLIHWGLVLALYLLVIWTGLYTGKVMRTAQVIRDANDSPYLIRYFIYKPKNKTAGRIYLHHIIRSDYDRCLHDHPWAFFSIMLWGSYREWTTMEDVIKHEGINAFVFDPRWKINMITSFVYRDFKTPTFLHRHANWRHRLELLNGPAWTLVFIGPKVREWGFWQTLEKWCHWKTFDYKRGICAEPEEMK